MYELYQPTTQHRVSSVTATAYFHPVPTDFLTSSLYSALKRFDLESWGSDENDNITGIFVSVICFACHGLFLQTKWDLQVLINYIKQMNFVTMLYDLIWWFIWHQSTKNKQTEKMMSPVLVLLSLHCELNLWGSLVCSGEQGEPSLWDSCNSLNSHLFPPDLINLPAVSSNQLSPSVPRYNLTVLLPQF